MSRALPAVAAEPVSWWVAGRWALPLLLVVPMLAMASALGVHAIIFPEGAALAMGIWVLGHPGWTVSRWRVAVLPPLCAVVGVVLVRAELAGWVAALLGLTVALLLLKALDSRLAPALSAAVLPIVFGIDEWSYPIAVAVICVVIVAGMPWLTPRPDPGVAGQPTGRYRWRVVGGAWLVIAAWILLGGELLAVSSVALAPPLFVSALEWLGRGGCALARAVPRLALLTGAGFAGSLALLVVSPAWLAGALAVLATLGLMRVLETPHAPALAIALLPQILDRPEPAAFTLAIAAGATALYLGVLAVATFRAPRRPRRPRRYPARA